MTFDNSPTPAARERNIDFAAMGPLYQLHPDADRGNVLDQLTARLAQLSAMLSMIHGGGFENFDNWSDTIKHDYLWGCAMVANECKELAEHV